MCNMFRGVHFRIPNIIKKYYNKHELCNLIISEESWSIRYQIVIRSDARNLTWYFQRHKR